MTLPFITLMPPSKRGLEAAGFGQAVVGEHFDVAIGHVRQRLRGGARVGAGHVGHAIMRHAFLDKDRIVMRGGARGFGAAALVNGDVHQHAAGPHAAQHVAA